MFFFKKHTHTHTNSPTGAISFPRMDGKILRKPVCCESIDAEDSPHWLYGHPTALQNDCIFINSPKNRLELVHVFDGF